MNGVKVRLVFISKNVKERVPPERNSLLFLLITLGNRCCVSTTGLGNRADMIISPLIGKGTVR